ncbi:MAG: aldehyde ferredoxin oxidoreductase family protein [Candidatus Njordarchaeota archaeon]
MSYCGQILKIDVSRQATEILKLREELLIRLIGGKGIGAYLLNKMVPKQIDPLSKANLLIFAAGPLNNTLTPLASKIGIFFKSPLTRAYGESYVGGTMPMYPKSVGYDAIIITGKAKNPTYIVIDRESVEFRGARDLWGLTIIETDDTLKREYGKKATVACIGPAGENKVLFSCIGVDKWRQAGRCGGGAVMGSKNLKAIVFIGGPKIMEPKRRDKFNELVNKVIEKVRQKRGVKNMREYGTPLMATLANEMGFFPTKYWSQGRLDGWENISAEKIKNILLSLKACYGCPIACGRYVKINTAWGSVEMDGPEYETLYALGGIFGVTKLENLIYLNYLADAYGVDTITLGNVLGFVVEASRREKVNIEIDYGDISVAIDLIKMIAYRNDIGDILADGVALAAKKLGLEDIAIHVKGLEPAGYDPRVLKGMSIAFGTSPRGACHLRSMAYIIDIRKLAGEPNVLSEEKIRKIVEFEDWMTSFDCLILCKFGRDIFDMELMWGLYVAVTGLEIKMSEYVENLKMVTLMTRYFNEREGFTKGDDILPKRFFEESIKINNEEFKLSEQEYMDALSMYYKMRGINEEGKIMHDVKDRIENLLSHGIGDKDS